MNEATAKIDIAKITRSFVNKMFVVSTRTIDSASKLFKKCAKIGTRILSVFKYKIVIQIAKINAEIMLPKGCIDANNNEVIKTENNVGRIIFNLFSRTPLKINSSEIGEMITVAIKPPIAISELFRYIDEN